MGGEVACLEQGDAVKPDAEALVRGIQQGLHDSILGDREKARGTYREFIVFDNNQVALVVKTVQRDPILGW